MHQTGDRTRRARRLRVQPTLPEDIFWEMVRGRRMLGLKFRRETPLAGYVVDFYCAALKLVIELDGGVHRLHEERDMARDERLRAAGFTVLRFQNEAFLNNPSIITSAVEALMHPSPLGGEGGRRRRSDEG